MRKIVISVLVIMGVLLVSTAGITSPHGIKLRHELLWLTNDQLAFGMSKGNQQQLIKFDVNTADMDNLLVHDNVAPNTNINLKLANNRKYLLWQFGREFHRYNIKEAAFTKLSLEKIPIQPDVNSLGDIVFSFYGQAGLYYLRDAKVFSQIYSGFSSLQRFSPNGRYIALVNQERFTIIDTNKQAVCAQQSIFDLANRLEWSLDNKMLLLTINPFTHGDFPDTNMAIYHLDNKKLTMLGTNDYIAFATWYDKTRLLYIKKPKLNEVADDYVIKKIDINSKLSNEILRYDKPITSLTISPDGQRLAFISCEENKILVYNLKKQSFELEFVVQ